MKSIKMASGSSTETWFFTFTKRVTLFSTMEINTDTNVTLTEEKAEKIERTVFGDDLPVWDDALQQMTERGRA